MQTCPDLRVDSPFLLSWNLTWISESVAHCLLCEAQRLIIWGLLSLRLLI